MQMQPNPFSIELYIYANYSKVRKDNHLQLTNFQLLLKCKQKFELL